MSSNSKKLLFLFLFLALLIIPKGCSWHKDDSSITPQSQNPLGLLGDSSPGIQASIGTGKKILFYLFHHNIDQYAYAFNYQLYNLGFQSITKYRPEPLPDLSNFDILVILDPFCSPFAFSQTEKLAIQSFVNSGKGFFYAANGDGSNGYYLNVGKANISQCNQIAGIFGAELAIQYTNAWYLYWYGIWAGAVSAYWETPRLIAGNSPGNLSFCSFVNKNHPIFNGIDYLAFDNSSYFVTLPPIVAGIKTGPSDYPPNVFFVAAMEQGNGKVLLMGDCEWLFPSVSPWYGEQNPIFLSNIIKWLIPNENIKIVSPLNGATFALNETINFVGSFTGNVSYFEWLDNATETFGTTLNTSKNNLTVGTHTITLRGRTSSGGTISNSITIGIKGGKPRVWKMAFKPMTGQTNWNKIYDRKGDFRKSTFLDPIQWQGKIAANEVVQEFCYPVSYVRSNATSVGNGPSKLRIEAAFKDLEKSPALNFTVNLTAKCKGNGIEKILTFNPVEVSTSNDLETSKEFESIEGLPDVVGIWELEFEWKFTGNGIDFGNQQTPQVGIQTLYTTWEKPRDDGKFSVKVPTIGGFWYAEELPTSYLEIFNISCSYANGLSAGVSEEIITTQIYDRLWSDNVYSFIRKDPDLYQRRGIDRILVEKNGWCGELAYLFHALIEIQGINVKTRGYSIKQEFLMGDVCWLVSDIENLPAAGQVLPKYVIPPKENRWVFFDHCAVILESSGTVFNPTFHQKNISFEAYVNDLFDVGYLSFPLSGASHWNIKSNNPSPAYIDIKDYP